MLSHWKERVWRWARSEPIPSLALPTFQGSKIRLRQMALEDVDALATFAMTPEVNEHVPHPMENLEDLLRHVRETVHAHTVMPRLHYGFVVEKLESREVVGDCSFSVNPKVRSAEMGYQISPTHWGNGYATEATQCMLECARSLRCVKAWTHVYARNAASVRVLEKCGFVVADSYVKKLRQGEIRIYRMERFLTEDARRGG